MEPWEYRALQTQGRPTVIVQLSQWDRKWLEQGLVRGKRRVGAAESGARTRRPVPGVAGLSLGPMWDPVQTGVLSPPRLQTAARGAGKSGGQKQLTFGSPLVPLEPAFPARPGQTEHKCGL